MNNLTLKNFGQHRSIAIAALAATLGLDYNPSLLRIKPTHTPPIRNLAFTKKKKIKAIAKKSKIRNRKPKCHR